MKAKYFVYPLFFLIASLFLSVGYAALSPIELDIVGVATSDTVNGIVMTNNNILSSLNVGDNELLWYENVMNASINLSNSDLSSYITYQITLHNNSNEDYLFDGITYDPTFYSNLDIVYSISGLDVGDIINVNSNLTFNIIFRYSDSITSINNNNLSAYLNFNFKEAILDINYYGLIDSNALISINYNDNYSYHFNDNSILDIAVLDSNGNSVNSNFSNGVLTINNVVNQLNIYRVYSVNYYGFKNSSSYPNRVMYGSDLNVSLTNTSASRVNLKIGEEDLIEGTDYTYNSNNKQLTINSVIGNISVIAMYPISYYGFTFSSNPLDYMVGGTSGEVINISGNVSTIPSSIKVYMGGVIQNNFTYSNGVITLNFPVNDSILITNNVQFTESTNLDDENLSTGSISTNANTFGKGTYIVNNNASSCIGSITININYSKSNGTTRTINCNLKIVGRSNPIAVPLNFSLKQNNVTLTQTVNFNYNDLSNNTYWPIKSGTSFVLDNNSTNINGLTINNYEVLVTTTECRDIE